MNGVRNLREALCNALCVAMVLRLPMGRSLDEALAVHDQGECLKRDAIGGGVFGEGCKATASNPRK